MLFRQNSCRKSQKGVYLHRVKSQKGVNMKAKKSQKGADDIIMKRKIYQQLLDWKEKRNGEGNSPRMSMSHTSSLTSIRLPRW